MDARVFAKYFDQLVWGLLVSVNWWCDVMMWWCTRGGGSQNDESYKTKDNDDINGMQQTHTDW